MKQMPLLKVLNMSNVNIANDAIPANAFAGRSMDRIVLPESLKEIRSYAFFSASISTMDCGKAVNLETIGDHAFRESTSTTGLDLSKCTSLKTFGGYNFEFVTYHVTLPESMVTLSPLTFINFNGSTTQPETLTKIGSSAFWGSTIKNISLPASVTSIDALDE